MNLEINKLLEKQPLLLFDGECGFCNKTIQFFLKHEKKNRSESNTMHFVPLESEAGKMLRRYFEIDEKIDSIILVKQHSAYIKSCAALRLTPFMRGIWPLMIAFVVVPPFLRNMVYDFIAKRRKKIFGTVESCALLKSADQNRFLNT